MPFPGLGRIVNDRGQMRWQVATGRCRTEQSGRESRRDAGGEDTRQMGSKYLDIAATPSVRAAQEHYGSAAQWAGSARVAMRRRGRRASASAHRSCLYRRA